MVTHTYATAGTFTVALRVWDDSRYSAMGVQQKVVSVGNVPPIASFTSVCHGLTCGFDASGSSDPEGPIASYAWDFGDATSGSGATASRTYASEGTYTVILTVTDNSGATSTHARTVTPAQPTVPPVADQIAFISNTCGNPAQAALGPLR